MIDEEIQEFAFMGRLKFNDSRVWSVFDATGNFHDACLDSIKVDGRIVRIRLSSPYFPDYRKYSAFGLSEATMTIQLRCPMTEFQTDNLNCVSDTDVSCLRFDVKKEVLEIVLFDPETYVDTRVSIIAAESLFEWRRK